MTNSQKVFTLKPINDAFIIEPFDNKQMKQDSS